MAKNLGTVKLYDNESLLEIVSEVRPDVSEYFNTEATWSEAIKYMDENGVESAEVRIDSLDFVFVEK